MNILIIDDETLVRQTAYRQLFEMDLPVDRIDTADSAQEARKLAGENSYDIFLCDIVMPEEDGISFARWALSQFPDSKIIFLTAHADFDYIKEAISMQSFDYVLQPVAAEEKPTPYGEEQFLYEPGNRYPGGKLCPLSAGIFRGSRLSASVDRGSVGCFF